MLGYFSKKILKKHDENNNRKIRSAVMACRLQHDAITSGLVGVGNNCSESIVVSLTSFPRRIDDVYLTIESIFQQSLKADKVVLWLSRDNFPREDVPRILRSQQQRGLDIEFCDGDLGSYKKIYHTLKLYPDSLIVTVDDDVIYPLDMVDQLYRTFSENPGAVYAHRAYRMIVNKKGAIAPYSTWSMATGDEGDSSLVFPTGVAGVMYSPNIFDDEVFNSSVFQKLCPNADDVWLKAMTLRSGVLSYKIADQRPWKDRFLTIDGSQQMSLKKQNWNTKTGNDAKLKAVFDHYDLYKKL